MTTALSRLQVSVLSDAVGELRHSSAPEGYQFTYHANLADHLSVALNMPTAERDYAVERLPAPFEQSLPEMNLSIFPTTIWKFVVRDDMGMLWASSQRRIGRVRFHSEEINATYQPSTVTLTASDLASTNDGDALFQEAVSRLRDIPGIAGIQPKVLVEIDTVRRVNNEAVDDASRNLRTFNTETHILKANLPEYVGATIVESICLDLAAHIGLPTSEHLLSGDGRLLAVKRFDIADDGKILGFDEVGALLGRPARLKYKGSLEQIARMVGEYSADAHRSESLRQLFTLCVLNNAVRNGDGHLKNFGLVYDTPADARLSPAYDVLSTRCFKGIERDIPALALNGKRIWDDFKALTAFGRSSCQLSGAQIQRIMEAVTLGMQKMLSKIELAREQYPYAAGTLALMSEQWQQSIDSASRHLDAKREKSSGLSL